MIRNVRSIILFFLLLSVLLFLVGFRYGKFVEHSDKTYVPPLLVTMTPIPTVEPTKTPLALSTYMHKQCNVSFLYPHTLKETITSSQEAELKNDVERIYFSCDTKKIMQFKADLKSATATEEARFNTQKVILIKTGKTTQSWSVVNPILGKPILFETTNNLTSLVLKTLEFVK